MIKLNTTAVKQATMDTNKLISFKDIINISDMLREAGAGECPNCKKLKAIIEKLKKETK